MPALNITLPEETDYRFVLQDPHLIAKVGETHPLTYCAYEETLETRGLALPDKPLRHTIFCRFKTTRDRAVREGWVDITDRVKAIILKDRPKITTPSQRAIADAVTDEWLTKAKIIALCEIKQTEWRTSIKTLESRGIVECNLGPRQRKSASAMAYRYRKGARHADAIDLVDEVYRG